LPSSGPDFFPLSRRSSKGEDGKPFMGLLQNFILQQPLLFCKVFFSIFSAHHPLFGTERYLFAMQKDKCHSSFSKAQYQKLIT
jgi:hypothetical protein